ncbi:MAG: LacI family transcriptional regulator [Actinomyces sp.]|jgi:DNA-binding LacI/PurR family transcriptional regulator|nr:LacI family DNA-binding transcriptional regulator [Actinomyces sp.]MCI1662800.1 LacI family transcriptional regulator [Actinomyces sp.]MCI1691403.1 LacI family transcriptional regulator [Actinomyces sp.]
MSTITDVAALAGVSPSTASRALRGSGQISAATRARVEEAARELDYVANPSAVRLVNGRTDAIGLVVPFVTRWFFAQAVTGAEDVIRGADHDLLLYNLGGPDGRQRFFERMPLRNHVAGVLVLSLALSEKERAQLAQMRVPLVTVGHDAPGASSVMIDDRAAAATAVQYLLNLGHRRIGLIGGLPEDPMHFTSSALRARGYREALTAAGAPVDETLIVPSDYTIDGGRRAAVRLLALPTPPTAIFAMSDEMAIGAIDAARSMGVRVPEDLSIVGFDDHDLAAFFHLTTIRQPVQEEGREAARILLRMLSAPDEAETAHAVLDTELILRASTAPLRR